MLFRSIVDSWFENDKVRAFFLYLATMWGLDYDLEGLGYLVPLMINRGWHFRLSHMGSHHVAHLMGKYISENGSRVNIWRPIRTPLAPIIFSCFSRESLPEPAPPGFRDGS